MRFTRAIVCPPGDHFAAGQTTAGLGAPDVTLAKAQHESYVRALEAEGLEVTHLAAAADFPDGTFIEDTAVVTARGVLLTRPGEESRRGEVAGVGRALSEYFQPIATIQAPGTLDGGDVCEADGFFFIGLSQRSNEAGAQQLARWLAGLGYRSAMVDIRGLGGLLHLKSGLSHLGGRRLAAIGELADHPAFRDWDMLRVPAGEAYAANILRVNDAMLVPAGFPQMSAAVRGLGLRVVELEMSEFRKMDGALSCLSLRW